MRSSGAPAPRTPTLSFGYWEQLPDTERAIQICHPDWRGVRTASYAFRSPVVECDDLERWRDELTRGITGHPVEVVIIQGWPPGAAGFARALAQRHITVKCVLHSSPAQHGAEPGEERVVTEVLSLRQDGTLSEVGMVKFGVAEAMRRAGQPVVYIPNRAPLLPEVTRLDLGPGLHIGIFAAPFWRKNVVTQLLSVALLDGAVGHVLEKPSVGYLSGIEVVEHGELPWQAFVALEASVDLNLYVTLTECHPLSPIESYLLDVPCLMSRTSALFRDDRELWELTTVDKADEPTAITEAAQRLLENRMEAIRRARAWISMADAEAEALWTEFAVGDVSQVSGDLS